MEPDEKHTQTRSATIISASKCECIFIPKQTYLEAFQYLINEEKRLKSEFLIKVFPYADISSKANMTTFLESFLECRLPKGSVIQTEGEPCEYLVTVLKGNLKIRKTFDIKQWKLVQNIKGHEIPGELQTIWKFYNEIEYSPELIKSFPRDMDIRKTFDISMITSDGLYMDQEQTSLWNKSPLVHAKPLLPISSVSMVVESQNCLVYKVKAEEVTKYFTPKMKKMLQDHFEYMQGVMYSNFKAQAIDFLQKTERKLSKVASASRGLHNYLGNMHLVNSFSNNLQLKQAMDKALNYESLQQKKAQIKRKAEIARQSQSLDYFLKAMPRTSPDKLSVLSEHEKNILNTKIFIAKNKRLPRQETEKSSGTLSNLKNPLYEMVIKGKRRIEKGKHITNHSNSQFLQVSECGRNNQSIVKEQSASGFLFEKQEEKSTNTEKKAVFLPKIGIPVHLFGSQRSTSIQESVQLPKKSSLKKGNEQSSFDKASSFGLSSKKMSQKGNGEENSTPRIFLTMK